MFITPKARRTRSLSVIHEDHEPPLACKSMDISAFNLLEPLDLNEHSETFISQDFACSTFYTVKTFSKKRLLKSGALDQVLMEQRILKHITELRIPFCTTLHWSFQNDEALYIVSVREARHFWVYSSNPYFCHLRISFNALFSSVSNHRDHSRIKHLTSTLPSWYVSLMFE